MKCRYCYGELDTALRCIVCGKDNQPLFSDSSKNAFEQNSDLTPTEVPETTTELVERIEQTMCGIEGEPGHENVVIDIKQAAALIESYAKQVPEKLLSIIYNMPPEFYSEWLDHAKEICQDFGYTVKG